MKIFMKAFVFLQMYMGVINGLVYAGFSAVTKKGGISPLDRYRCAETYVGFEYVGQILSPDGSCTAVPYGWTGVVSSDSEFLKKTLNCNVFDNPIALFQNSNEDSVRYKTQIPGEMMAGLSIEIVFVPKEPWNQIVFDLENAEETNAALHISFRRDFNKIQFNSKESGKYNSNENANDVEISSDKDATLKVDVLSDSFKVSVNGKEKYIYKTLLIHSIDRQIEFRATSGSHSLLKSVCFYNFQLFNLK